MTGLNGNVGLGFRQKKRACHACHSRRGGRVLSHLERREVGGGSLTRQQHAVRAFAKRQGLDIVDEFYDPAVSGKDPIDTRPGFSALLDRIEENGVRTVLIEDPSRFAAT